MNHPLMPALAEIKLLQDRLSEKNARVEQLEAALREITAALDRAVTRGLEQVERIATLEAALREIADKRKMDAVAAVSMQAIARAALDQSSPPKREENSDVSPGFRGNNDHA